MNLDFLRIIDDKEKVLCAVSDYVWDNPELAFAEYRSSEKLMETLSSEGFTVEKGLAGIETAFSGTFGSGRPVIGVLGEFDALSGLGQEAGKTEKCPDGHAAGHGCGHNLLGTAALGGVIGIKKYLEETGLPGTVIYFGCPGEEGGSGKAFMAKAGCFDCLDAAVTWHPDSITEVRAYGELANYQVLYKFEGKAAHAGATPHLGRSALDAVELMNVGVNFLREHVEQEVRMHYAITDAGGCSPNVVQAHAEVLYLMRAPRNEQLPWIYQRINDIAKGAALMTGTTESHDFIKACSNIILNDTMQRRLGECMAAIPVPVPAEEDLAFARRLTENALSDLPKADPERPLHPEYRPYVPDSFEQKYGSTDVGDVSWVCPTVQFAAATETVGTPGHSWQYATQGKQPWAHKMMLYAAKVIALMGSELLSDPVLLKKAQEEFQKRTGPDGYICPIPDGVRPRAMTSL